VTKTQKTKQQKGYAKF